MRGKFKWVGDRLGFQLEFSVDSKNKHLVHYIRKYKLERIKNIESDTLEYLPLGVECEGCGTSKKYFEGTLE